MSALPDSLEMDFVQRFNHADGLAELPFEEQKRILSEWTDRVSEIQDMAAVNNALNTANNQGLRGVTKLVDEWPEASEHLVVCFELAIGTNEYCLALFRRDQPYTVLTVYLICRT